MSSITTDNKESFPFSNSDYTKYLFESNNLSIDRDEKAESASYAESDTAEARRHNPLALRLLSYNDNADHFRVLDNPLAEVNDDASTLPDQALVQDQFNRLLNDEQFGALYKATASAKTTQELESAETKLNEYMDANYPELKELIVNRLGYGNIVGFIQLALSYDDAWVDPKTRQQLNENVAFDMLFKRLDLPYGESAVVANEDSFGKLPDVDAEANYVKIKLADSSIITFDGPEAGRVANEFAKSYNNSETFRTTMHHLAQEQDGIYSFHIFEQAPNEEGMLSGFNFAGTQKGHNASGVYLNRPSIGQDYLGDRYSTMNTIIHETGHDLHDCTDCDDDIPSPGGSHSREHSIYIGSIINEIENNGVNTNIDIDDDDYSNNISIFGLNTEKPTNMEFADPAAFDMWKQTYGKIQEAINLGDYRYAAQLMASIPPDETIELNATDPQEKGNTTVSYNVHELIAQELLLQADSDDWLNTDKGEMKTIGEKFHLSNFFNYMNAVDSNYSTVIDNAAATLNMDLGIELPGYDLANMARRIIQDIIDRLPKV
ncbi:MAG: hypothetical protein P8104_00405 [Gammaproteobacteria bacterium]